MIVSEPSNPWITGVSNLFTREFYETALSRLAPGGRLRPVVPLLQPRARRREGRGRARSSPSSRTRRCGSCRRSRPEDGSRTSAPTCCSSAAASRSALDWPRLERAFADARIAADLRSTRVFADAPALVAALDDGPRGDGALVERRASLPARHARSTPTTTRTSSSWRRAATYGARRGGRAPPPRSTRRWPRRPATCAPLLTARRPRAARAAARVPGRAPAPERATSPRAQAATRGRAHAGDARGLRAYRPADARGRGRRSGGFALDRRDYARAEEAHRALLRLEPANGPAWLRLGAVARAPGPVGRGEGRARDGARDRPEGAPVDRGSSSAYVESQAARRPGGIA